ncbi:MAG: response regulator transcription factor [Anaerolineae bacterium]|nr:response regulator transcription factor [Anaerolineae bacterium]
MPKILIIEDDPTLLETLAYNLARQEYEVHSAADGVTGLEMARAEQPDLIVLDLMLPGIDGLEVCRIVRQEMSTPILMLTARTEEIDKVVGLEVGADDYMTKPFSVRELLARVKALLRRVRLTREALVTGDESPDREVLSHGGIEIDLTRREVTCDRQTVRLKPKEFDLLTFLVRNRGMALSRDLILERVWGWDYDGGTRTVDVHVRWLREKLERDPSEPTRIITVRGVGYRFET